MNVPTELERERPLPPDHQLPPASVSPAPPHEQKPRRSFWWVWLLLFAGLGYGTYRWYVNSQAKQASSNEKRNAAAANRPVPVVAAPAHRGNMPVYLRGLGNVSAFNTVTVKSRVDGQLTSVNFREGQTVTAGQVLAQIDPRPYQAQLDQALGQLARDQAQLKDAQVNLERYQALWDGQVIAKQQLDTQGATVGQFRGTIEADQAAINTAKLNVTYATVTAPITGVVGLRLVDAGNIIHASDATGLIVITQLQPISVLFTIPADNLPPVLKKLRGAAQLPVDAYDRDDRNKIASGHLLTVDNQIDQTTGTSRLKAVFDNKDAALFPNQFVNARLLLDTKTNITIIPVPAIQRGPQGSLIYVVTPDKTATVRQVTLGLIEGADAEVLSGVAPGEMVVTDGMDKLQEGSKLDVRQASSTFGSRPKARAGASKVPASALPPPASQSVTPPVGTPPNAAEPGGHSRRKNQ